MGCQRKTLACKLQVVACSLPFFFWKIEWRDIILVFYVCIYLLFPNLTMYSVPHFTQLSFVWIIFQRGKIFISGRLSLLPRKRKKQVQIEETPSKRLVIPIVSVYSSHQFWECDKYLFESITGVYFSRL